MQILAIIYLQLIPKKPVSTTIRVLTKAVFESILRMIENRILRLSFIYKIEI